MNSVVDLLGRGVTSVPAQLAEDHETLRRDALAA
jgi:hypothetical protein